MIPLVVLAGFMGAGKTRLLAELTREFTARGARVHTAWGDSGDAGVEGFRVAELQAQRVPLSGYAGGGSTRELLNTLYRLSDDPGSLMLIESCGAVGTDQLLVRLASDVRLAHYTLPLQVTVVDVARWQRRWPHNDMERAHVQTATHMVLDRTERVVAARTEAVREMLHELNPAAEIVTRDAFASWLLDMAQNMSGTPGRDVLGHVAVGRTDVAYSRLTMLTTVALWIPETVDRDAFRKFVQDLPSAVIRARGLVRFSDAPWSVCVWSWLPRRALHLDSLEHRPAAQPVAVFTGMSLPLSQMAERLATLVAASP